MQKWPVPKAQDCFNDLLEACSKDGPQTLMQGEAEVAVLISIADWHILQKQAKPTLKSLLLSEDHRSDFNVPTRGNYRHRDFKPAD